MYLIADRAGQGGYKITTARVYDHVGLYNLLRERHRAAVGSNNTLATVTLRHYLEEAYHLPTIWWVELNPEEDVKPRKIGVDNIIQRLTAAGCYMDAQPFQTLPNYNPPG